MAKYNRPTLNFCHVSATKKTLLVIGIWRVYTIRFSIITNWCIYINMTTVFRRILARSWQYYNQNKVVIYWPCTASILTCPTHIARLWPILSPIHPNICPPAIFYLISSFICPNAWPKTEIQPTIWPSDLTTKITTNMPYNHTYNNRFTRLCMATIWQDVLFLCVPK